MWSFARKWFVECPEPPFTPRFTLFSNHLSVSTLLLFLFLPPPKPSSSSLQSLLYRFKWTSFHLCRLPVWPGACLEHHPLSSPLLRATPAVVSCFPFLYIPSTPVVQRCLTRGPLYTHFIRHGTVSERPRVLRPSVHQGPADNSRRGGKFAGRPQSHVVAALPYHSTHCFLSQHQARPADSQNSHPCLYGLRCWPRAFPMGQSPGSGPR